MNAADLANDQDRELTVVTAERDDLQLRLDEAEAVIDAVRKVRVRIAAWAEESAVVADSARGDKEDQGMADAYSDAICALDEVDGL